MRIGSSELTRSIDNYCVENLNIPSIILMENAAIKVVKNIDLDKFNSFTIVCGSGNNGGDGLAVARQLFSLGKVVNVFMVGSGTMTKDTTTNYDILINMGLKIEHITKTEDAVKLERELERAAIKCLENTTEKNHMVIDAIFGIGLKRKVEGIYEEVINIVNEKSTYTLAIDIPSGIQCDSFGVLGTAIKANKTVSFEFYKKGFLDYEGESYTGEIIIEKIGVPDYVLEEFHQKEYLVEQKLIKGILKKRSKYAHKGDFGRVTIIAGSENYTGAAYISTEAAVKSGAGLVTLCTDKAIVGILQGKLVEAMTMSYCNSNFEKLVLNSDSIAIGPGMGNNENTFKLVKDIISKEGCPVVIDADGLNVLKDKLDLLKNSKRKVIITPHMGEMSRLTGIDTKELIQNRIEIAKAFAKDNNIIVLLKGYNTIITDGTELYINSTGNSKMASGGMGDTLTGIIASFIGQGYKPMKATILATYLHGYAGDELSKGRFSVNATEVIEKLPYTIEEVIGNNILSLGEVNG